MKALGYSRKVREMIDIHVPVVVGGALKLALDQSGNAGDEHDRRASGLTAYYWDLHSSRVLRLAKELRSILPPA